MGRPTALPALDGHYEGEEFAAVARVVIELTDQALSGAERRRDDADDRALPDAEPLRVEFGTWPAAGRSGRF